MTTPNEITFCIYDKTMIGASDIPASLVFQNGALTIKPNGEILVHGKPIAEDIEVYYALRKICDIAEKPTPNDSNAPTQDAVEVAARAIFNEVQRQSNEDGEWAASEIDKFGKLGMDGSWNLNLIAQAALSAVYPALVQELNLYKKLYDSERMRSCPCGLKTTKGGE